MVQSFERYVARERARLTKERERLIAEQEGLAGKVDAVERELRAIDAYVETRTGQNGKTRRGVSGRRGRRSSKRASILRVLKEAGEGLGRGDILLKMGLKGDKAGEQSVSNALSALKKAGSVTSKDRKYRISA